MVVQLCFDLDLHLHCVCRLATNIYRLGTFKTFISLLVFVFNYSMVAYSGVSLADVCILDGQCNVFINC